MRLWILAALLFSAGPFRPPTAQFPDASSGNDHLLKARAALQSGKLKEAEQEFREVVRLDPSNVDAQANIGAVQYLEGDWTGAAKSLRIAVDRNPSLWKAQSLLGLCEKRLGEADTAQKLLSESIPNLPASPFRTNAQMELLELYYQVHDLDKAEEVLHMLERENPTNTDVLYAAYRIYADLANRARDSLSLVAPDSGRMHELMAQHLINEGNVQGAIAQYRKALEADPKLSGVHYELGEAILQDSTSATALNAAEQEFEAALRENPADASSEARLGMILDLRSEWEQAMQHYATALKIAPNNPLAQAGMGRILIRTGKRAEAVSYLEGASRNDPLNANLHYQLAIVYRELDRTGDADREFAAYRKLQQTTQKLREVFAEMRQKTPGDDYLVPPHE
jgi:predicted Zn-dependent protease